mmetsp:Transcript_3112/g.3507  ORF Transcript_3112/g.3507 Transcript_3112/m.3507 type:complete len:389 (-) Transcript_3112:1388-2554(-)
MVSYGSELKLPVDLSVKFEVVSIDTLNQTFLVDVTFNSVFDFPEKFHSQIETEGSGLSFTRQEWEDLHLFVPQYLLQNSNTSDKSIQSENFTINKEEEKVVHSINYLSTIRHIFVWNRFPFDRQIFKLSFMSLNCQFDDFKVTEAKEVGITEWDIKSYLSSSKERVSQIKTSGDASTMYGEIDIFAERESLYYIREYFSVITGISCVNLVCLGFDPSRDEEDGGQYGDRINVTITLMLTLVAFKFVMMNNLPKAEALTLLDKFMVFAFVVQGVFATYHLVASFCPMGFCTKEVGLERVTNDMCGILSIFGFWILIVVCFIGYFYFCPPSWTRLRRQVERIGKSGKLKLSDEKQLDRTRLFGCCTGPAPGTAKVNAEAIVESNLESPQV